MSRTDNHNKPVTQYLKTVMEFIGRTGKPFPMLKKLPASKTDNIGRLHEIKAERKWYWKSRDHNFEIGGVGSAYVVENDAGSPFAGIHDVLSLPPDLAPLLVGGKRFAPGYQGDSIWSDFPDETLFIPETSLTNESGSCSEIFCRSISGDAGDFLSVEEKESPSSFSKKSLPPSPETMMPEEASSKHFPDYGGWCRNVNHSLEAIKAGLIRKVVLARRTDYLFNDIVDPFSLLRQLTDCHQHSYAMLYQPRPGTAFISVTPERLYRRVGQTLSLEALSSTVPRGVTPDDDRRLEDELLNNHKLRHEHQVVIDGIVETIGALCQQPPEIGATEVMKLDRIQHLKTPITGYLRDQIGDDDIISALHPTPAVGGLPRDAAIEKIRELEGFDRGWYAGPVGYISREQAEFAVGIRSLLVHGRTVSVFTGAGIVAGSDPDAEWREIDSKDILRAVLLNKAAR